MDLSIKSIKDIKNLEKERLILKVDEDCELGDYLVFSGKIISDETISSRVENTYWIPDQSAKKGDLVVIYSKDGTNGFKKNNDETTSYFYYRRNTKAILDESLAIILLKTDTFVFEKAKDLLPSE